MNFRFPLLLVALLWSGLALAGGGKTMYALPETEKGRSDLATLVLPEDTDIEMVDGIVYPGFKNLFRRGDLQVRILPGEHQIALKYNQLFEWGSGEHEVVRSKILVVGFTAQAGQSYRVDHDRFASVEQARKGVENFSVRVLDAQGANQVFGAAQISSNWKGEQTVMKRGDLASPDAAAAALAARQIAATPVAAPPAAVAVSPAPAAPAAESPGLTALRAVWQSANEQDRAAFRAWLGSQP